MSTAALPSLSRQAAMKGLKDFRETLGYSLRVILFLSLPSTAGLIVLGRLIVRVFFERGAFDALSTAMTTQALVFYCTGLWAFSGIRILIAGFYALQDTRTPFRASVFAAAVNLACSLALMGPLRHGGLALALSIASAAHFLVLAVFLARRIGGLDLGPTIRSAGISLLSSAAMAGLLLAVTRTVWSPGEETGIWELTAGLALLVSLGAFVYFLLSWLLGSTEKTSLMHLVRSRLRSRGRREKGSGKAAHNPDEA